MIIKDNISKNRVLSSIKEKYVSDFPVITRYLWKLGTNSKSLQLVIDEGNGSSFTIELDGEIFLSLGMKRCLSCGEIIHRNTSHAICDVCKESLQYKCRRCLFEGPGKPFNVECTPKNPPCQLEYMQARCWSSYYLYLGRFCNKIKVGVSSCKRRDGKYYRLIEQGLDEALVLSKFPSLKEAMDAETQIAELFNLTTYFTFVDKVNLLVEQETSNEVNHNFNEYIIKLKELYPDITFSFVDLIDVWPKIASEYTIKKVSFPHTIKGNIKASRGNVLLIEPLNLKQSDKYLLAYNLSHLVGCELESVYR